MSAPPAVQNPFPGPQPYRAADRSRFYGRDAIVKKLSNQLLARSSTTLYGPSGAGKSSLMQAGVIPRLQESHDFLVVRVDGWPPNEAPLPWLVRALCADLDLGPIPAEITGLDAVERAMELASRRSDQPISIYLDQLEQLLFPGRAEAEASALIAGVDKLARSPIQGLQIVLALREDYLGRFRDRARDHRELLAHGFRLGPMTVGEMVKAVCRAAADGIPPQRWDEDQIRGLMREVRVPGQSASDEAEVQAAYAQIVCRALFQTRAQAPAEEDAAIESIRTSLLPRDPKPEAPNAELDDRTESESEAEFILRRYLDATLEDLGPLSEGARRLLEDHLVTADGSRTLRTEKELLRLLPEEKLSPILKALEGAAILHAEAHQGSRYFEIGHDWLARKVYEERLARERHEERRRREVEQAEALRRQRAEAEERLEKARAQRRSLVIFALASLAVAAGAAGLGLWALSQQKKAEEAGMAATAALGQAQDAEKVANERAIEASDARLLAGFRELKNRGQLEWGTKLLLEIQRPERARGFITLASEALGASALEATLIGHSKAITAAAWSPDGARVVTASADLTARIWAASGEGNPIVLSGHRAPLTAAAFSPDGRRVLTASEDGSVRLWSADGSGAPVAIEVPGGAVFLAAWSPDGSHVVTGSADDIARVYRADGGGGAVELRGHAGRLTMAAFIAGDRVLTASEDGTARVWSAKGGGRPVVFKDHKGAVLFAAATPDGARIITASADKTARIWASSGKGRSIVLDGHDGAVVYAAWSPDGTHVATASADRTARLWSADGEGSPVVFTGHTLGVTSVAFRPDGRYLLTASRDRTARVWPVEGGDAFELRGHDGPIAAAAWGGADGARVLTAAGAEDGAASLDHTARVWRPASLEALPRERRGFFHSANVGPGGDLVASAYDDATGRVWRIGGRGDPTVFTAKGHAAWVASAALSPDGARIATASFDKTARIERVDGAGGPIVLEGHNAAVRAVAFSPDGARVVTASDDKTALVRSADGSGAPVRLEGHTDGLRSVAWSPDGARVVTTSLDRTARIFLADGSGSPVVSSGHRGGVYSAAFSADGARVFTVSLDNTVKVWSSKDGALAASLEHGSYLFSAAWSPDGERIATSTRKDGLRVLQADGKGEPLVLAMPVPAIALAFLDGGKRLLAVGADNTTRTFTIDIEALRQGLERANADCLPPDKRATYLGEPAPDAEERYEACERARGRTALLKDRARPGDAASPGPAASGSSSSGPNQAPPPSPIEALGPSERRVPVFVIPGDAIVELDGRRLLRTNGVIELPGQINARFMLRVFKGNRSTGEKLVIIKESGASPSLIDLNEASASGAGGPGGKPRPARYEFGD